jgi:predicted RNase H-like HicB family nuclease
VSSRPPPSDPFYYDWPCSLELDGSANFVVTPFYLEGCRRTAETEELALQAAHECIRAFVEGDVGSHENLTKAGPVESRSGRVITITVDISSARKT